MIPCFAKFILHDRFAISGLTLLINSHFRSIPRGVLKSPCFTGFPSPAITRPHSILYNFLTALFRFLRMSNMAPHSSKIFDPTGHFLRRDLIFAPNAPTFQSNGPNLYRITHLTMWSNPRTL